MKAFKDHFSAHASAYARYRPQYPQALFEYLASVAKGHEWAWDCGTGNGQAALGLTPYFEHVLATDPSEEQLRNAFQHPKITYRLARAEEPVVEPRTIDLITAAQALHWFDYAKFFEEAKRALKPDGVIAVWTYTLSRIAPEVDRIVDTFYSETVGPYWPKERKIVDEQYRTIEFPFKEFETPQFSIELHWSLEDLLGYLRTWSPTRRFIERNGYDPVDEVEGPLSDAWGDPKVEKLARWPIHLRVGVPA